MKVKSIWRYPVKSMGGEKLESSRLSHHGVVGDRCYAVHDGKSICSAKKYRSLMQFSASYVAEPDGINNPAVTVQYDGSGFRSDQPDIDSILSGKLGTAVTLDALRPAEDLDYYHRESGERSIEELRSILGLEPGEPFPDFSAFPEELSAYASPPGTFFDAYPLLIITTSSMNTLQAAAPDTVIDERRFRPNLVIDSDEVDPAYLEENWQSGYLEVGEVGIELTLACPRCAMVTLPFDDLGKEPQIMRALIQENHHKLGIYGRVVKPGNVTVGDTVQLSDSSVV